MNAPLTGNFYDLTYAREPEQRQQMIDLEAAGICIFCPEHFGTDDRAMPLLSTTYWHLLENSFPYANAKHHLLLVPSLHVHEMTELPGEVWSDLQVALVLVKSRFRLDSYGFAARNGKPHKTGGTIRHLHIHILVGDGTGPVRIKLAAPDNS